MISNEDLYAELGLALVRASNAEKEAARQWQQVVEWERLLVERLPEGLQRDGAKLGLVDAQGRVKRLLEMSGRTGR